MNRPHAHGDLPEPVRRYWMDLRRSDPPMDLLDEVVAELEKAPRPLRFSFVPVAGMLAAATVAIAILTLNLWPAPPRPVGTEESTRPSSSHPAASLSPTLPPGVVPIRDDPPLAAVPLLEAEITEWNLDLSGWPVLAAHGSVWFSDSGLGQLTRVDAASGEITAVIDVSPDPSTDQWELLAMADDRWVYAAGLDETLAQIDPATNEIVQRIPIGTLVYRMKLHDEDAFITDLDRSHVTRVDLSSGDVVWQVRVGVRPGGLEVTDEAVWVASYGDARLHRLDPETGELLEDYPAYVHGMDILHDGEDALYITGNQGRPMERFSIPEGRVTARIAEMSGTVIHDGHLYALRGEGQLLVLLDPDTLEWQAVRETGTVEAGIGEGAASLWIYETGRLMKVQASP